MSDLIVTVQRNGHANLDSFPFRYGFSQSKDFHLLLNFDSGITTTYDKRKRIENAQFKNPSTGEINHGNFVISKDNHVVTVIREDEGVDETLSKALRVFREYKYVTVNELIKYFHPLYVEGNIKTHGQLKHYWIKMNIADTEKIGNMEESISKALNDLDKEKEKHSKTQSSLKKATEQIQIQETEINKIQKIGDSKDAVISSQNTQISQQNQEKEALENKIKILQTASEQRNIDTNKQKEDYPDVDWNTNKITSAVFDHWKVEGDFLCVYLIGKNYPVRLKKSFKYDYPAALEDVKKISKGDLIDYVTKGTSSFSADQWFSKIMAVKGFPWMQKFEHLNTPSLNNSSFTEVTIDEISNSNRSNFDIDKGIRLLKEQKFTSETSFTINFATNIPGSYFLEHFGHNWKKDMIYLVTDKGYFVDTSVEAHGGTEWITGKTYHNCRITSSKRNTYPYWIQK